jgi:hypothetical protein
MAKSVKAVVRFKTQKAIKLIEEGVEQIVIHMGGIVRGALREQVPVDTGNLRESQIIGEFVRVGRTAGIVVGSDEDQAPYAPFAYFPGITRNYAGNDWIGRTVIDIIGRKEQYMRENVSILSNNLRSL